MYLFLIFFLYLAGSLLITLGLIFAIRRLAGRRGILPQKGEPVIRNWWWGGGGDGGDGGGGGDGGD